MPDDTPIATLPHACHAKRTLTNSKMHESPRLPRLPRHTSTGPHLETSHSSLLMRENLVSRSQSGMERG